MLENTYSLIIFSESHCCISQYNHICYPESHNFPPILIKSTSAKGPKKVQRTTQTRNVHFDRRRPQTLELRRYIFYSEYSNWLIIIKDVFENFIIMYSYLRLSSLASKMSDSSDNPYSQNGRSYKTRNSRHGLDINDADSNGR